MSDEKRLKARVAHKHKKEAEWYLDVYTAADSTAKRSDPFIPLNGELIIFDEDENHTKKRFKIGDGEKDVIELPFALDIDSLEKEWDLIITDPDDLATKLADATGNVLVKLKDKYTETLTVNLNSGLKLLDFGNSYIESVNLNPNLIDSNAETAIRNLITSDDTSANNSGSHIKWVSNVKNCRGIIHYKDCSCIEDSDIASAEFCTNINHSRTVKSTRSNFGVFVGCSRINNIDVSSHADENLLFDECRYISNIRHSYAEGNPSYVRYSVCTYVDPYTCAGYVSPDNSGKVPVPDDKGGVVFKTVVPVVSNTEKHNALYVQVNEANGGGQLLNLFGTPAYGNYIAQRTRNCQLTAPLQAKNPERPDDKVYLPDLDEYISRRYLEANAPSGGGSKLYRHDIAIELYHGGVWNFIAYVTVYTHRAEAYTHYKDIMGEWNCSGFFGDDNGTNKAQINRILISDGKFHAYGGYVDGSGEYSEVFIENSSKWQNYSFFDNVTEV